jgi:serine/threonine-protein kinase
VAEFTRLGDRYDIGAVIGRGGMAEVFQATDSRLNRRVAIKVLRGELARDPIFIERFRREAQAAAGLNHPNIVAVYDTGEDLVGDVHIPFIVMEFVDGMTLRQMLNSGPRILPERGLEVIAGVLAALDYAHRHGIIHRDIKPANIMINSHGDAKVMDFGIARAVSDAQTAFTATSAVMGTAQYLSPEQARGEVVDARSDIYSAGCVLYELLTGRPPFNGETPVSIAYQHVNEPPKVPSSLDDSIPATLDAITLHALSKAPGDRYQTAAEMRADVERAIAGMPINAAVTAQTPASAPLRSAPENAETTQLHRAETAVMPVILPTSEASRRPARVDAAVERRKWVMTGVAVVAAIAVLFALGGTLFANRLNSVTVPNLKGKTVAEAQAALANVSLVLGTQTPQVDNNVPKGIVITQLPAAGESLQQGQPVNITISNGKEQTTVPELIDLKTKADADLALRNSRLLLGKVTVQDSEKAEGTVLEQSVPANTSVDIGTRIDIVISSGKIPVPSVTGESRTQAKNDLINAGFKVQIVTEESTKTPGTVIAQTPLGGELAPKGSTVTITVAVEPTVPTPPPSSPPPA